MPWVGLELPTLGVASSNEDNYTMPLSSPSFQVTFIKTGKRFLFTKYTFYEIKNYFPLKISPKPFDCNQNALASRFQTEIVFPNLDFWK